MNAAVSVSAGLLDSSHENLLLDIKLLKFLLQLVLFLGQLLYLRLLVLHLEVVPVRVLALVAPVEV